MSLGTLFEQLQDLFDLSCRFAFILRAQGLLDALMKMGIQNARGQRLKGRRDGLNLNDDLGAIAPLYDHSLDAFDLTPYAPDPA
jgi:hypothetical protein